MPGYLEARRPATYYLPEMLLTACRRASERTNPPPPAHAPDRFAHILHILHMLCMHMCMCMCMHMHMHMHMLCMCMLCMCMHTFSFLF